MDFKDKFQDLAKAAGKAAGDAAKVAGDKAGDAIEIGKLKAKIASEKKTIDQAITSIGSYYYDVHKKGGDLDADVEEFAKKIDEAQKRIDVLNKQIEVVKQPAGDPADAASGSDAPDTEKAAEGDGDKPEVIEYSAGDEE
ncbi:MAG: hypothetical protein ACI4LM_00750 [Anaerovoracaceae bacterium]|jgi:hypothetical protein